MQLQLKQIHHNIMSRKKYLDLKKNFLEKKR